MEKVPLFNAPKAEAEVLLKTVKSPAFSSREDDKGLVGEEETERLKYNVTPEEIDLILTNSNGETEKLSSIADKINQLAKERGLPATNLLVDVLTTIAEEKDDLMVRREVSAELDPRGGLKSFVDGDKAE
jgi:hypothetical protein